MVRDLKAVVLYASKTGNTGKVAKEIAAELHCESRQISKANSTSDLNLENYDLIFIGTGIRAGNPNEELIDYLRTINLKDPKPYAIFVTWGGAGKTDQAVISKLKDILESKGQKVIGDYFFCYGGWQFALLRRGHPNNEDFKAARNWAKNIVDNVQ